MTAHHRTYSDDELVLFSRYRDQRAACRPDGCIGGDRCWVEIGPPGIVAGTLHGQCNTYGKHPVLPEGSDLRKYIR